MSIRKNTNPRPLELPPEMRDILARNGMYIFLMLYFPLSSVLLAVTDLGFIDAGHGYRKSLMRRLFC